MADLPEALPLPMAYRGSYSPDMAVAMRQMKEHPAPVPHRPAFPNYNGPKPASGSGTSSGAGGAK
jgi:hypothetical protein